jgi:hypothetical protein
MNGPRRTRIPVRRRWGGGEVAHLLLGFIEKRQQRRADDGDNHQNGDDK